MTLMDMKDENRGVQCGCRPSGSLLSATSSASNNFPKNTKGSM
jgi:hypothetical protein